MPRVPPGLLANPVKRPNYQPWYPPAGAIASDEEALSAGWRGLNLKNSLTGVKERFIPRDPAQVRWYTCGPTVYDACHMGHARAYLTFDIFRRVLTDYFGYEFLYTMNITDIDDKIIIAARANHLLANYKASNPSLEQVCTDVAKGFAIAEAALDEVAKQLAADVAANKFATEADREGAELALAHKQQSLATAREKAAAATDAAGVFEGCKGYLTSYLDNELKATVTDHAVFRDHARRFEREFYEDMNTLGVLPADVIVRVTEHVPEIVDYIAKIIGNGFAYAAEGNVYFDSKAYQDAGFNYPLLRPGGGGSATATEMAEGEGALAAERGKKRAADFALWKSSREGEPRWQSPWGEGRPGWHIECSVMASGVLGETMDLHAGGIDLRFPHHDNEIAQAQACSGVSQWCNYFVHAGHLHIQGLKMAKSLKNFITIRQALSNYTPRQLRMLFVLQQWNANMDFSDQKMDDAIQKERVLKSFLRNMDHLVGNTDWAAAEMKWRPADFELDAKVDTARKAIHSALCDDLNTPLAFLTLFNLITDVNSYAAADAPRVPLLRKAVALVKRLLTVVGLDFAGDKGGDNADKVVHALVGFRQQLRTAAIGGEKGALRDSILSACDELRDSVLPDVGVRLDDAGLTDSRWGWDKPEDIRNDIEKKRAAAAEAGAAKAANALAKAAAEYEKAKGLVMPSCDIFRAEADAAEHYSEYDADGIPTKDKDGNDIPKSGVRAVSLCARARLCACVYVWSCYIRLVLCLVASSIVCRAVRYFPQPHHSSRSSRSATRRTWLPARSSRRRRRPPASTSPLTSSPSSLPPRKVLALDLLPIECVAIVERHAPCIAVERKARLLHACHLSAVSTPYRARFFHYVMLL